MEPPGTVDADSRGAIPRFAGVHQPGSDSLSYDDHRGLSPSNCYVSGTTFH